MDLRTIDRSAWLEPALLVALVVAAWLVLAAVDFAGLTPLLVVLVAVLLSAGVVGAVALGWRRAGGVDRYVGVRRWARGGQAPAMMGPHERRAALQQLRSEWTWGWAFVVLAALWLCIGLPRVLTDGSDGVSALLSAAIFFLLGLPRGLSRVRHGRRVAELLQQVDRDLAELRLHGAPAASR